MDLKIIHRPGAVQVTVEGPAESEELKRILSLLQGDSEKLWLLDEQKKLVCVSPKAIVWAECVDDKVFVYTDHKIYQASCSLAELEAHGETCGLFRCSKSALLNLHAVHSLTSRPGGRIEAMLQTGEKILISRRYAPLLRDKLQGGF